jgi:hypothetical protein
MIFPNKYKKDILNLNLAFDRLDMRSASSKLSSLYAYDLKKLSALDGAHNDYDNWSKVSAKVRENPPSSIAQAAEKYLQPASDKLDDTPSMENVDTEGIAEAVAEVEEAGIDLANVMAACIRLMNKDSRITKSAGAKAGSSSWKRTIEITASAMLEEYKRVFPNSITNEEIKLASINAGKHYSNPEIYKTAALWSKPFEWAWAGVKAVGKPIFKTLGRLLPLIGVAASLYFAVDAWKKWRQEISFIFTELNAGSYGIDDWDTLFVGRLSGKIDKGVRDNHNISLSNTELPPEGTWKFTPEVPEEVTMSNLWGDMKGAFTGGDTIPEPNWDGETRQYRNKTGNPDTYNEIAALNISCEAIMDNAYLLLENIVTGIVSLWAAIGEVAGLATFGLASGAISAIDAVVSAALMVGSWARRKALRRDFTQNRNNIIGIAIENMQRLTALAIEGSVQQREEWQAEQEAAEQTNIEPPTGDAPDINIVPTITRAIAPVLKAATVR